MQIRPLSDEDRAGLPERVMPTPGSPIVTTPFRTYDVRELAGFAAVEVESVKGMVTYSVEGVQCEIVTIDAFEKRRGVGSALVNAVKAMAQDLGCARLMLFTTNDNLRAQGFYRSRGFLVRAFYPDAMDAVRRVKPTVPMTGDDGIPLRDMIEFEMGLTSP